jgi:hypothetical protein
MHYQSYQGSWTSLPDFSKLKAQSSGIAYGFNPADLTLPKYDFALVFDGFITIAQPGSYIFYTKSNDGSRLYIDGRLVVDNDLEHLLEEKSGKIHLNKGWHALRVTYFQSGGAMGLQVLYEGPGLKKQVISPVNLYRNKSN